MKHPRLFIVAVALVALMLCADIVAERLLAARLPQMLSETFEQPVAVSGVGISLFQQRFEASAIVIGTPEAPAVTLEALTVELNLAALLNGSLRPDTVHAVRVTIDPRNWPSHAASAPLDTTSRRARLPAFLAVDYLELAGPHPLVSRQVTWQTLAEDTAALRWQLPAGRSLVDVYVHLSDLNGLVMRRQGAALLEATHARDGERLLTMRWRAGAGLEAISHQLAIDSPALRGRWHFDTPTLFAQPLHSRADLDTLDMDELLRVWEGLTEPSAAGADEWLSASLPVLSLPPHELELRAATLRIGGEAWRDLEIDARFESATTDSPAHAAFHRLAFKTAVADLEGRVDVSVGPSWQLAGDITAVARGAQIGLADGYGRDRRRWRQGSVTLAGEGDTMLALLSSAAGSIDAEGTFLGSKPLPMRLRAEFTRAPGRRGADEIELAIGASTVRGALWTDPANSTVGGALTADTLNLDELDLWPSGAEAARPWVIPDASWLPLQLPISVQVDAGQVIAGNRSYRSVAGQFTQTPTSAALLAGFEANSGSSIEVSATADRSLAQRSLTVRLTAQDTDVAAFGVESNARIEQAQVQLAGHGQTLAAIVSGLQGDLAMWVQGMPGGPVVVDAKPSFLVDSNGVLDAIDLQELEVAWGDNISGSGSVTYAPTQQVLQVNGLQATTPFGRVEATGVLNQAATPTTLELAGSLDAISLERLVGPEAEGLVANPLAGTFTLAGAGDSGDTLLRNLLLNLTLAEQNAAADEALTLDATVSQRGEGVEVALNDLRWRASDARGKVRYTQGDVPGLHAVLRSQVIDVRTSLPQLTAATQDPERPGFARSLVRGMQRTLGFLSSALTGGATRRQNNTGSGFFSTAPWRLGLLDDAVLEVDWHADEVRARRGVARKVELQGTVDDGRLTIDIHSDEANGGALALNVELDAQADPPRAEVRGMLNDVRPDAVPGRAPLTAFVNLSGTSTSEAAFASTATGQLYLASGRGETTWGSAGLGLLAGDLVQTVIQSLVPRGQRTNRVSCAVAYAEVADGRIATPAALVMRTPKANIVMRAQADLRRETISAQFDFTSRTGAGISLGNVLSSTMKLRGPLTAPKVVPNTNRIAWRYGAAIATGGLSLLGESVFKRLVADRRPCQTLTGTIRQQVCAGDTAAAASSIVCPAADGALRAAPD